MAISLICSRSSRDTVLQRGAQRGRRHLPGRQAGHGRDFGFCSELENHGLEQESFKRPWLVWGENRLFRCVAGGVWKP